MGDRLLERSRHATTIVYVCTTVTTKTRAARIQTNNKTLRVWSIRAAYLFGHPRFGNGSVAVCPSASLPPVEASFHRHANSPPPPSHSLDLPSLVKERIKGRLLQERWSNSVSGVFERDWIQQNLQTDQLERPHTLFSSDISFLNGKFHFRSKGARDENTFF
jgi:hypothetical protein